MAFASEVPTPEKYLLNSSDICNLSVISILSRTKTLDKGW